MSSEGIIWSGIKLKIFVKEQAKGEPPTRQENVGKYMKIEPLTGEKAKSFYEDILKEPSAQVPRTARVEAEQQPKKQVGSKMYKDADLLLMAQNNEAQNLRVALSLQELNVDVCDDFGWTPLMCAACSGAEDAVKVLLEQGADINKRDKLGNTAVKLANIKNRKNVVKIIEDFFNESESLENKVADGWEPFFCEVCNDIVNTSKTKHESSTLHLFNRRKKVKTFYGIPESNKGFQLLLKKGWDKESGLGPDGRGRKFPVKAFPKKDKKGIGAPKTQTYRNDQNFGHNLKYENKKQKKFEKWKEKEFEKKFRLEFS